MDAAERFSIPAWRQQIKPNTGAEADSPSSWEWSDRRRVFAPLLMDGGVCAPAGKVEEIKQVSKLSVM